MQNCKIYKTKLTNNKNNKRSKSKTRSKSPVSNTKTKSGTPNKIVKLTKNPKPKQEEARKNSPQHMDYQMIMEKYGNLLKDSMPDIPTERKEAKIPQQRHLIDYPPELEHSNYSESIQQRELANKYNRDYKSTNKLNEEQDLQTRKEEKSNRYKSPDDDVYSRTDSSQLRQYNVSNMSKYNDLDRTDKPNIEYKGNSESKENKVSLFIQLTKTYSTKLKSLSDVISQSRGDFSIHDFKELAKTINEFYSILHGKNIHSILREIPQSQEEESSKYSKKISQYKQTIDNLEKQLEYKKQINKELERNAKILEEENANLRSKVNSNSKIIQENEYLKNKVENLINEAEHRESIIKFLENSLKTGAKGELPSNLFSSRYCVL